jgi:hypothetical protein
MAKWIYNRLYEFCSTAELDVARVLARLNDAWTIRWGFYYDTVHEGDFIILGPTGGVLVLEVKGGQLRKLDITGRWEGPEQDHPLMQLSAEWKAVIQRMESFADTDITIDSIAESQRPALTAISPALCLLIVQQVTAPPLAADTRVQTLARGP